MAPNHRHQRLTAVTIDVYDYDLEPQKQILNNVDRKVHPPNNHLMPHECFPEASEAISSCPFSKRTIKTN